MTLAGTIVKTKKKCCKSGPRCKRCPAAMRKLERKGLATRVDKRHYLVSVDLTKKDFKATAGASRVCAQVVSRRCGGLRANQHRRARAG